MLWSSRCVLPTLCLVVISIGLAELAVAKPHRWHFKRDRDDGPTLAPTNGTRPSDAPSPIHHVLETCLYIRNMNASVHFYRDILGMDNFMATPKLSGFALGVTTLLLFHLGETSEDTNFVGYPGRGQIAGHGPDAQIVNSLGLQSPPRAGGVTVGGSEFPAKNHPEVSLKLHFAFAVETVDQVHQWETYFKKTGVHIHSTMDWDRGGRSVYFYDPDGHVGEIVSHGIWPHW